MQKKELNAFQKKFMQAMVDVQEWCVGDALYGKHSYSSREEELYAVTSEVIYRIMELIDGYGNNGHDMGRLNVVCEKTGEKLKENPFIELHDVVCDYIKEL